MKLDEISAQALCTVVTVGFIVKQTSESSARRTVFGYDAPDMPPDYFDLYKNLLKIGVEYPFVKLTPHSEQPVIIAHTARTAYDSSSSSSSPAPFGTSQNKFPDTELWTFIQLLEAKTDMGASKEAPLGAYIGGTLTAGGSKRLFGPTSLVKYKFKYAQADRPTRDRMFGEAKTEIEKATKILSDIVPKTYEVTCAPMPSVAGQTLGPDEMFGSVHGMVNAMVQVPPGSDDQMFHFEYAMGRNTSKVASCIPCSLFMSANGRPASATHLGRGDYWNFPAATSDNLSSLQASRKNWERYIAECYELGTDAVEKAGKASILSLLKELDTACLGDIFLESLTFPGKFTDKLNRILG